MKQFAIIALLFLSPLLVQSQNMTFKKAHPCSFSIELPADMKLKKMEEESNLDYCDYEVLLKDGSSVMQLHSLVNSRFEYDTIEGFYDAAVQSSELTITYKTVAANYFVISGVNNKNKNIVYWKRVLGPHFVSDLHIEYSPSKKSVIEKHIRRISKSFTSD